MNPTTRNRLMLLTIFVLPIVVFVLFWLYGKGPPDSAATPPVLPPP